MINFHSVTRILRWLYPRPVGTGSADRVLVSRIRAAVSDLSRASDDELPQRTRELRERVVAGESILGEPILVPALALVTEATRRVLGIELYDVQLLAGLVLARGAIAEMQTGEGKTYAALLPASVHALAGQGVHVMTVNAYLAARDHELLMPVYQKMGLTVGLIQSEMDPAAKRAAYLCDVTYGPGYEFGFDFLRDKAAVLAQRRPALGEEFRRRLRGGKAPSMQPLQRGHAVAIVDEADSVMLDEATTPLLLATSGNTPSPHPEVYRTAARIAAELERDVHFTIDLAASSLRLNQAGLDHLAANAATAPRRKLERPWPTYVEQALRAKWLFAEDVHFLVADDEIRLIDQCTGRIFADRTWRDGLHQAIQVKAGVTITAETKSIARITRQRYMQLYGRRCGMTGTAQGAEHELRDLYGLPVAVIPPHRPCLREVLPVRAFALRDIKERAIVDEVVRLHATRRPVLIGTASVEASVRLAQLLDDRSVKYQLLNGKQDAEESAIVAQAGQLDAVTIATNMAGRGTDIKLPDAAKELGGLHVIATEPQDSSRIDRQLVGRAARQGDRGSCQLFASADDNLFQRHAPRFAERMRNVADESGEIRSNLARDIARIQRQVDQEQTTVRRQMLDHDDWLETVLANLTPSE